MVKRGIDFKESIHTKVSVQDFSEMGKFKLTEEEIKAKYDGQLSPEMTMPTSHLIAKIFKVLSQTPVSTCVCVRVCV